MIYDTFEDISALGEIFEHIKACRSGGEHDIVARGSVLARGKHRRAEIIRNRVILKPGIIERRGDLARRRAAEHGEFHLAGEQLAERFIGDMLIIPAFSKISCQISSIVNFLILLPFLRMYAKILAYVPVKETASQGSAPLCGAKLRTSRPLTLRFLRSPGSANTEREDQL